MKVRIQNEGTIVILYPETDTADEWLRDRLDPNGPRWGATGYVVEHSCVDPILEGFQAAGGTT